MAYVLFVMFFAAVTHWNMAAAMYFVMTTMEGSPDTLLCSDCGSSPATGDVATVGDDRRGRRDAGRESCWSRSLRHR